MAFKQYTKCVTPQNHSPMNEYVSAVIQGLGAGGVSALIAVAMGHPWCALLGIEIFLMVGVIAFCEWWLYDRLICLDGDRGAIGMLVSIEPATGKSGLQAFDTDYSINLLLYDNDPGVSHADAELRPPYGELIKEQDATKNLGLGFSGEFATDKASGIKSAILHAEFEGAGIQDLKIGTQVGLGLTIAALVVCLAVPGPVGAIIAGILAFLAFLAALIGALIGLGDTGSPADVDPNLGALHTNDPANGGQAPICSTCRARGCLTPSIRDGMRSTPSRCAPGWGGGTANGRVGSTRKSIASLMHSRMPRAMRPRPTRSNQNTTGTFTRTLTAVMSLSLSEILGRLQRDHF